MPRYLLPLFATLPLFGATLDVYSDRAFYTYEPKSSYIGFAKHLDATNTLGSLTLEEREACADAAPLCKLSETLKRLHVKHASLKKEREIINTLLSKHNIEDIIDPDAAIATASKLAAKITALQQEQQHVEAEIKRLNTQLNHKATASKALHYATLPQGDVTLSIAKGLSFHSEYDLDIDHQLLKQNIVLTNRSGIDIEAKEVQLFERAAGYVQPPIIFHPRKIFLNSNERNRAVAMKAAPMMAMDAVAEAAIPPQALHVSKEESRSYRIENLTLPSNGVQKRSEVASETLEITQQLLWHPYRSNYVFESVTFEPKSPIESAALKVHYQGKTIENAPFRKEGKKVRVNAAVAYDIETARKPITEFSESKGFFGSDRLKQEGYTLTLTNRSKENKTIQIIERIPLSTQEEITVTLEQVRGDVKHTYNEKNGKLQMQVTLDAGASKEISYSYAIRYPKEVQIRY